MRTFEVKQLDSTEEGCVTTRAPPLHQGKWTPAEEEYVEALTSAFKAGVVPIAEGTTLRAFLSNMLNCPAKRISKKMVGTKYNGKQLYTRKCYGEVDQDLVSKHHKILKEKEANFIKSLAPLIDFNEKIAWTKSMKMTAPVEATAQANGQPAVISPDQQSAETSKKVLMSAPMESGSLSDALQANSLRCLVELRSARGLLGLGSGSAPTARQTNIQLNTQDLLLAVLRDSRSQALNRLSSSPTAVPAFLLETLKRKLETQATQDINLEASPAKKLRQD